MTENRYIKALLIAASAIFMDAGASAAKTEIQPSKAQSPISKSAAPRSSKILDVRNSANCAHIASYLERRFRIPKGLLKAIATVESRQHPWVVNVDGAGKRFASRAQLIQYIKSINPRTVQDFYVGWMQISYKAHRSRLGSLENFADPYANMEYAAKLLCLHKKNYGTWEKAVQYYHSCYPGYNQDYQRRVYVAWRKQEKVVEKAQPTIL